MRQRTMTVVSIAAALLLPVGCSSDDPSEGTRSRIRFQVSGEAEEIAVYRTVEAAFEKEHPEVDIRLVEVPEKDDHLQKLATDFAAGDPAEVFLVNFREYPQFVVRGAIDPIEDHLDAAGIDLADYYDEPLEAFTYDGALQCMPQNVSSLVVYYNLELFRRAGIERPRAGWTWDDFRAAAVALTAGDVKGVGIEPNVIRLAPFVWSNGGEVVDDLDAPTRFTLDTPEAREALEFLVGLVRQDGVVPTEEEVAAQDLETRFATGKLGMVLSSRRETPFFREATDLRWDVAPLPQAGDATSILHSDAYCISRGTEDVEAAEEFVGFAVGEEGATITALGGRTVPSLREVATGGAFLNPALPPAHSEVFLDAIPTLRRTPVLPTWPEIEDLTEEILTKAFYEDGYTIDDALDELREADALFEEGAEL